jgi:dihydroneopterin aldolase
MRGGKDKEILRQKILLENVQLVGHHGVHDEERERGQLFAIDAEVEFDFPQRDKLSETVDYIQVIRRIDELNRAHAFQLIETFAQAIAERILRDFRQVQRVHVKVKKLRPLLTAGITLDAAAAEVIRDRTP